MVSIEVQLNIIILKIIYFGHKTVVNDLLLSSVTHLFRS